MIEVVRVYERNGWTMVEIQIDGGPIYAVRMPELVEFYEDRLSEVVAKYEQERGE